MAPSKEVDDFNPLRDGSEKTKAFAGRARPNKL